MLRTSERDRASQLAGTADRSLIGRLVVLDRRRSHRSIDLRLDDEAVRIAVGILRATGVKVCDEHA